MKTNEYKFYMQATDSKGVALEGAPIKDLEVDFEGLRYLKATGLNDIGEARVYTETFADSDRTRVYIPSEVTHKQTSVTLSLVFVGKKRHETYDAFLAYITNGFHAFWDSARNKRLVFYVESNISPSEDLWSGSNPYLKLDITLKNVYGKTENI